jgi:FdrA protein
MCRGILALVRNVIRKNFHRDSLLLLKLSEEAKKIRGIKDAAVVMGTVTNKEILTKLGLLTEEGKAATDSDMIVAVMADSESEIKEGLQQVEVMIVKPPETKGRSYYSVEAAIQALPDANLAIVSVPGEYARGIVRKLLERGINVHLFSDHVPPEHELELKQYAASKGLLVMGPGAGTSLIGGKAIAFANVIRRGKIGIVAAAGTGLQEVSVLLSEAGLGVSAGLGTGGGDVKAKIRGLMMLQSIDALEKDPETSTIVVVSKLPDPVVSRLLFEHITSQCKKRYVTCFLGPESYSIPQEAQTRVKGTKTLHAAFSEAVRSADPVRHREIMGRFALPPSELKAFADEVSKGLNQRQQYIRGLYTGGTLAYETLIILGRLIGDVYSNAPLDSHLKLSNSYQSMKDSIIDLGEEEFTSGRAHPMIDPTIRKIRLVEEAKDPEVAVILLDIMLGYGSHSDPAGAMLSAITEARGIADSHGRVLRILGHVCGTEQDPQPLSDQEKKLRAAGIQVFKTNATMAIAAAMISKRNALNSEALADVYDNFLGGFQ